MSPLTRLKVAIVISAFVGLLLLWQAGLKIDVNAINLAPLPPAAAQSAEISYTLMFRGTSLEGAIDGIWGGTLVQGAYARGRWALVSAGRNVVDGTYRCGSGCTFDGTVDYGTPTKVTVYVRTLTDTERTEIVSGSIRVDLTPPTIVL